MVTNPNSLGNRPINNGETGWEGVAAEAGKMKQPEHLVNQPPREMTPWQQEVLRRNLEEMAKPANIEISSDKEKTGAEELKDDEARLRDRILHGPYTESQKRIFISESADVQSLMKDKAEIDAKPARDRSRGDRKAYEKTMSELRRYGYSDGGKSKLFAELQNGGIGYGAEVGKSVAQDREFNFELLRYTIDGEGEKQRAVKKALKRQGFKKLPESFDDENFTSHEIRTMAEIARVTAKDY